MSITIKISTHIQDLAELLVRDCKSAQKNLFTTLYFATQTKGLNNWLKLELAKELEILANYKFCLPEEVFKETLKLLGKRNHKKVHVRMLKWTVFKVLSSDEFKDLFPSIAHYYLEDEYKKLALSSKIAVLFDQYEGYRPEMIEKWNENEKFHSNDEDENWQVYIWGKCAEFYSLKFQTKKEILKELSLALEGNENREILRNKFGTLYLVGLNSLTKSQWDFFKLLSTCVSINVYFLDPASQYKWLPEDFENVLEYLGTENQRKNAEGTNILLKDLAALTKDNYESLFHLHTDSTTWHFLSGPERPADTLLHKIQYDIRNNLSDDQKCSITDSDLEDESVVINACFTEQREVEVVYNYICRLIADKKINSVHSVLVLVSDLELYTPYIKAVFDYAPYPIPYVLSGQKVKQENIYTESLLSLFQLNDRDFTGEKIINLLEHKPITERFEITNLDFVQEALEQAAMRNSFEGNVEWETNFVSFKNGIHRLLLGFCIARTENYTYENQLYSLVEISDNQEMHAVISFCHFVELLNDHFIKRKGKRKINEWITYTKETLVNFIYQENNFENEKYNELLESIESIGELIELVDVELTFDLFLFELKERLNQESDAKGIRYDGIVFSNFIQMRSIPYDYIAMLGMNLNDFPRTDKHLKFDLLYKYPLENDRSLKKNDRQLFLEYLISAKKGIYFSFIGRGDDDNAKLLPSTVVEELIEYIGVNQFDQIVTLHPLHWYSKAYNSTNKKLYSYIGEFKGSLPSKKESPTGTSAKITEIDIAELIKFFRSPFKYYYNNKLSIYFTDSEEKIKSHELFELDNTIIWSIKKDCIKLEENDLEEYRLSRIRNAELSLHNISKVTLKSIFDQTQPGRDLFNSITDIKNEESENFILQLRNDLLIKGKLSDLYGNNLIEICISKSFYKYKLDATIKTLVLSAIGKNLDAWFLLHTTDQTKKIELNKPSKEEATESLLYLCELYLSGMESPLPYFNGISNVPKFWEKDINVHVEFTKLINNLYMKHIHDEYLIREVKNGFFKSSKINQDYLINCRTVDQIINKIFN